MGADSGVGGVADVGAGGGVGVAYSDSGEGADDEDVGSGGAVSSLAAQPPCHLAVSVMLTQLLSPHQKQLPEKPSVTAETFAV